MGAQHTPGPWVAHTFMVRTADERDTITHVGGHLRPGPARVEEARANARLIAAAPDLLAALKMLHDDVDEYQRINNLGAHDNHVLRVARAAIAKAETPE